MPKTGSRASENQETAAKVAEGIGDALGRIVNRIEALDREREKAYHQLLALQERLNVQVARVGEALGSKTTAAAGRPADLAQRTSTRKQPTRKNGKKKRRRVTCGVCGTVGHNARGHAKWQG